MRNLMLDAGSQPIVNLAGRSRQISAAGFRHSNNPTVGTRAQWYEATGGPVDRGWWTWTWSVAAAGPLGSNDLVVSESPNNPPVTVGNYYSAAIWVLSTRDTVLRAQAQMLTSSSQNAGTTQGPATAIPANIPTLLIVEGARALSTAVALRVDVDHVSGESALWQVGDVFKIGALGIYDGMKAYTPFDGYTPGCRFLGDVNSVTGAQSVGYPYTLAAAAGMLPAQERYISDTTLLRNAVPVTAQEPLTLFGVGARRTSTNIQPAGLVAADGAVWFGLQGSSLNPAQAVAGFRASGGLVDYARMSNSLAADSQNILSAVMTPASGLVRTNGRYVASENPTNPVTRRAEPTVGATGFGVANAAGREQWDYLVLFRGAFTPERCYAVERWLAHTYGLPLVS